MLKQSAAAAVLDFAAGFVDRLVAVVGSVAAEIVDILVAPGTAAVVVDILVHCAEEHSPQTDSYVAANESDVLVLTNECRAAADLGVAAAAFVAVAVGRTDIDVDLVDKMAVEAAVSVEYSDGAGSAVADFAAVVEAADRVVDFAVAAESIGSVTVASGFDTVDAEASAVLVAAVAVIATSDCVLGCSA